MEKVIIVGGGTLGRFVLEIVERINEMECVGFLDDSFDNVKRILGYPILGKVNQVDEFRDYHLTLGIGSPDYRQKTFGIWEQKGLKVATIIDPTALISKRSIVNEGAIIGPFTTVLVDSEVGKGVCILSYVNINQNVQIGSYSLIGAASILGNDVEIGIGCHIGLGSKLMKGESLNDWEER